MSFDPRVAIQVMEQVSRLQTQLQAMPQLIPLVQEMLVPSSASRTSRSVFVKPVRVTGHPRRVVSMARRKQMSLAAKKRWAAVKRAGKTSLREGRA
jgi:hypothetical protein